MLFWRIMKSFLRNNAVFLVGVLLALAGMISVMLVLPKAELHLALNGWHNSFLDVVMRAYTDFVAWPVYLLMLLPLVYRRWGWTVLFAASEVSSALVVQLLKLLCNMPRPKTFFAEMGGQMNDAFSQIVVDGVSMHSWHSFPSGHTATFFVFFSICAFLWTHEHKPAGWLFGALSLLLALLGGYSRIYLSQHFMLDVCVGMLEGTLMASVWYMIFIRKGWIDKTIKQNKP